jgi:hypothetical protein
MVKRNAPAKPYIDDLKIVFKTKNARTIPSMPFINETICAATVVLFVKLFSKIIRNA